MGTRLKIEVDLESGSVGSVDDAVRALRRAADQLAAQCGVDCEYGPHCRKCWNDLTLTDTMGIPIGTVRLDLR